MVFMEFTDELLIIATGVKVANPDLSVWVATGDGDLSEYWWKSFYSRLQKKY